MPFRTELIQSLWDRIMAGSTNQGSALGVLPVFGVSPIDDPELPPEIFHERVTLARSRAAARDPISYYSAGMESYLEEEMHLLMEVAEALERDEFTFFAQPQCGIFSGKVVGAEPLVRCRQVESFHARELLDGNLFTDTMVNNILGAAAIYEVCNGQMEITRINEQGYRLAGLDVSGTKGLSRKTWDGVRDDDRPVMLGLFERAYERRPGGAEGNVHYIRVDGRVLWIRMRVFFLREHEGRRVYFVGLTDITALREHRREKAKLQSLQGVQPEFKHEQGQLDQWYGMLPCGFGLSRIALNREGEPIDYDIIYLQLTLFQHDYGYVACLLRDVTNNQVYEGSFRGIVHPEDLDRVEWEITRQIERSDRNMDFVQYRIIRKDGGIRWVDDWGHLETSKYGEENQLFYVFVKDVTDTISEVQTEKLLNSNRYYWPESRSCGLE